jgi:peptidoglycan/LPS O-acetylase OafA/YrhL
MASYVRLDDSKAIGLVVTSVALALFGLYLWGFVEAPLRQSSSAKGATGKSSNGKASYGYATRSKKTKKA